MSYPLTFECECCHETKHYESSYEVCEDCFDVRFADKSVGEVLAESLTNAARADEAVRLLERICDENFSRKLPDRHFYLQAAIDDAHRFIEANK